MLRLLNACYGSRETGHRHQRADHRLLLLLLLLLLLRWPQNKTSRANGQNDSRPEYSTSAVTSRCHPPIFRPGSAHLVDTDLIWRLGGRHCHYNCTNWITIFHSAASATTKKKGRENLFLDCSFIPPMERIQQSASDRNICL